MQHKTRWITIAVTLIVGVLATAAYAWTQRPSENPANNTEQAEEQNKNTTSTTKEYKSAKGVTIEIDNWVENRQVSSPLTISGRVPGNWSFEGEFPIGILFESDIGLPGTTAKINGDWMTSELVPFTATLTFDEEYLAGDDLVIILRNANPSGAPDNDDSMGLKVRVVEKR